MFTPDVSGQRSSIGELPLAPFIKWNESDLQVGESQATAVNEIVKMHSLKGTHLSCTTSTEAGQWKNRKAFIEKVAEDIIT